MKQKPFVAMKGSEIMEFVRDALLDEAARKKGFIDDCEKVAGGVTPPEDRQRVRTLEAAGEMLTYVIVVGSPIVSGSCRLSFDGCWWPKRSIPKTKRRGEPWSPAPIGKPISSLPRATIFCRSRRISAAG
jgi:hypothetical protein